MQTLLEVQRKLLPDFLEAMQKRYNILRYIKTMEPVGRRTLASNLHLTERTLRSEVDFLKEQNLLEVHKSGMRLSSEGRDVVEKLDEIMREVMGIDAIEKKLQKLLEVDEVIVVPGDCDVSPWVQRELGKACAFRMKEEWAQRKTIACTGGTTMAAVGDALIPDEHSEHILFVPARGGIGRTAQNQANTIVEKMAEKIQASYKVLYVPDQLSKEAYASIIKEPSLQEVISAIKSADMVIHGIGEALVMAERRNENPEVIKQLTEKHAVGEALGSYFNEAGEIVERVSTVGIHLEDLSPDKRVIAVAGGKHKAKAIQSYMKRAHSSTVLITDEAVAQELIQGF